ncbi:hypothetical protein TNCT_454611 [Trichonephila clavata]|uniref:Uncharacterized protein n=1 Tax=Trichonephila clavata TaxID=2740835 RepID=A0A8X6JP91_TRICU|nr:hypothetical protein TNCT_454611 [Trichonephila clavata]
MVRDVRLDQTLNVRKNIFWPTDLRAIGLGSINTLTSGFISTQIDFNQGAGVFCDIFHFTCMSALIRLIITAKNQPIHLSFYQLSARLSTTDKAVSLSDSSSALQALASNQDKQSSRVQSCRELLSRILTRLFSSGCHPMWPLGKLI